MEIVFLVFMFVVGAGMGSFACCQAWRMRYAETGKKELGKWSVCLGCGRRLSVWENLPVVSWVALKGKCRKCGAKIGAAEILSEILLGAAFLGVGAYYYGQIFTISGISLMVILKMVVVLCTISGMGILAVYDAKWGRLPNRVLIFVNVCAIMYLILRIVGWLSGGPEIDWWGLLMAIGLLAGVYYLLYFFSKEKLVGGGDWILCLAIAVVLADWFLALVTLFLANLLASVVGMVVIAKKGKKAQIPFGPFLVVAFVTVFVIRGWLGRLLAFGL